MAHDPHPPVAAPGHGVLTLRALLFWVGMFTSTLVFAPLSLFTAPFPFRSRYAFISQWARFNLWWLGVTCALHYRVEGREHIPPTNAVVLAKHQSAWETLALQRVFTPVAWVLKRELLWLPFFGWGLALVEPIAIDRKAGRRAVRQVIDQGTARLQAGRWVVIFPEGTRVAPGTKGRYGIGGALLAAHSGYPVVPVAHNAGEFWPRRGFIKRPGTIRLVIGPTIPSTGRTAAEIQADAENWIEDTMARIGAEPAGDER